MKIRNGPAAVSRDAEARKNRSLLFKAGRRLMRMICKSEDLPHFKNELICRNTVCNLMVKGCRVKYPLFNSAALFVFKIIKEGKNA